MFNTDPRTKEEYEENRRLILIFCTNAPRTHHEVRDEFGISGISAAAYLKFLKWKNKVRYNEKKNTFIAKKSKK